MKNFLFFIFLFFPLTTFALVECPIGLENDPYPGLCGSYVDQNNDNLCDLSQTETNNSHQAVSSEEELKAMTVKDLAGIYKISVDAYTKALSDFLKIEVKETDSLQVLHDKNGLCSGVAANIAVNISSNEIAVESEIVNEEIEGKNVIQKVETKGARYKMLPIAMVLLIIYLITYILKEKKTITVLSFRRIWNVVLLFSFLVSAILGIFLIIRINWGFYLPLPFNMLYWHVETGTVMAFATLIHISWYWRFYTTMFKKKK